MYRSKQIPIRQSLFTSFAVACFLVSRQRVAWTFPRRKEIEGTKFLRELERFVDKALLLIVVAQLDETGERKILTQWMAVEPVVGHQPAHVRMTGKEHAVEIVGFALEPVRARKYPDDRRNGCRLVAFHLHADGQVLLGRQGMINDVEAALAAGPFDRRDVNEAPELAELFVAQKRDDLHDVVTDRAERQLTVCNSMPRDRA